MTTINLKDFYYWYLTDELVEVPDEVAELNESNAGEEETEEAGDTSEGNKPETGKGANYG